MIKIYLKDEEEERDFEIHVRLIIAVLFASEENAHYEWDFAIEKRILYQPNKSIEYIHLKKKIITFISRNRCRNSVGVKRN
jgi:hypothetical protein